MSRIPGPYAILGRTSWGSVIKPSERIDEISPSRSAYVIIKQALFLTPLIHLLNGYTLWCYKPSERVQFLSLPTLQGCTSPKLVHFQCLYNFQFHISSKLIHSLRLFAFRAQLLNISFTGNHYGHGIETFFLSSKAHRVIEVLSLARGPSSRHQRQIHSPRLTIVAHTAGLSSDLALLAYNPSGPIREDVCEVFFVCLIAVTYFSDQPPPLMQIVFNV